ncbi:MAG: hypothetical protein OEW05_10005 [Candidatus Aminicenantes bacterium]|nr:hypothetical protein [Candidatus Aminicenantes bacterium]
MKKLACFLAVLSSFLLLSVPLAGYDNSPSNLKFILEALWAPATGGGTWTTELQITNFGSDAVHAYFFPRGAAGSYRTIHNLWLPPGNLTSVIFPNILATLQALDPSFSYYGKVGALMIDSGSTADKIQVSARTVNGNFGKTLPGLNWVDSNCANVGRPMMIQDLRQNSTYRTFVGCWNTIPSDMTVRFELIDSNNGLIGSSFTKTIAEVEFVSFNPFAEAGVPSGTYDNVWLYIFPESSVITSYGLMSFASSANNLTNDTYAHMAVQFQ